MEDLVNFVTLADGSKIILQDEDGISLSLISNDGTKDIFQFPYHSGGYGGGSLLLSPSERYVISALAAQKPSTAHWSSVIPITVWNTKGCSIYLLMLQTEWAEEPYQVFEKAMARYIYIARK